MSGDNYATDTWLLDLFDGWFDPCPLDPEWSSDGLLMAWPDRTFVNPPYSSPLKWVEKAIYEHQDGKTIVLLLKYDSSTKWFRLLHEAGANFLYPHGRLKFRTGKSAPFPSLLAVLSK
tara:strand:+ start:497 stop:850 length:354 start_codon:yes stop_codon:yes gene_type:complete